MTQEEKELLLKDLCARLPYGLKAQVKINAEYSKAHKPDSETCIGDVWGITINKPYTAWVYSFITKYPCGPEQNMCSISDCKPYLRPMSSMTEEEKKDILQSLNIHGDIDNEGNLLLGVKCDIITLKVCKKYLGELNKRMFDVCHMIEKGLALEAIEGMYDNDTRR